MTEDVYKLVSARIDGDWYPYHENEWFTQTEVCTHFQWREPHSRQAVSKKLYYDCTKKPPFLEKRNKAYRIIDKELSVMDWQNANPENVIPLSFPFGLQDVCKIYPKSIIIVAGSKNAGKTKFMYNFIYMNMRDYIIDLFNSETGVEQMKERFTPLNIIEPAPFNVYERYDNFADVINPEHISVIDYLDMNSEVYMVGAEIDAIFRKLTTGVAVIGLQKPPPTVTYIKGQKRVYDRDLAYGGGFTAKRAVLYITMGSNKLKLLYVKTPRSSTANPNNMSWTFGDDPDGIHFNNITRFTGEEE